MIFRCIVILAIGWSGLGSAALAGPLGVVPPEIIERVAPVYPESLRMQRVIGRVDLVCTVDEAGRPTKIFVQEQSQPEFAEAAKTALAASRYRAGIKDGFAQPMRVGVQMEFTFTDVDLAKLEAARTREILPAGVPTVDADEVSAMPDLKKEIRPKLPKDARSTVENAVVRFVVDENGVPRDVHLLVTTSAGCGPAAVEAVRQWRFTPGRKGNEVVRVNMEVPISFFPGSKWASGARVRPGVSRDFVTMLHGQPIEVSSNKTKADQPETVYREPLGFYGDAAHSTQVTLECIINPYGVVTHVRALDTTDQQFAIAAERCFSRWRFKPRLKDGQPVYYRFLTLATFQVI